MNVSGVVANTIESEEGRATPATPLCKNGHMKTEDNTKVVYDKTRGTTSRRCIECMREASYRQKRAKRQDAAYRKRESDFRKAWRKRKLAEDPDYFSGYSRKRYKSLERSPEAKAKRRAAAEAYRRSKGQVPREEYLRKITEQAAAKPRVSRAVPWEIRDLWRRSAPGSILRRKFPTPMALNDADFDVLTQLVSNRED